MTEMLTLAMEQLPKLMAYLNNCLPECLPIYYTAENVRQHRLSLQEVHFVVNTWPEPSGVALVSPQNQGQLSNYRTTVDIWVKDAKFVQELLADCDLIDWCQPIFFRVLGSTGLEQVHRVLKDKSDVDCVKRLIYVLASSPSQLKNPPAGYTLHSLDQKDAETVGLQYTAWGVEPSDTVSYFQACVKRLPSSGVKTADGELASYVVLHHTNAFGSVVTDARHRRRGLGETVVTDISRKICEDGQIPYVFVNPENTASIKLYEKCGFLPKAVAHRLRYVPVKNTFS